MYVVKLKIRHLSSLCCRVPMEAFWEGMGLDQVVIEFYAVKTVYAKNSILLENLKSSNSKKTKVVAEVQHSIHSNVAKTQM